MKTSTINWAGHKALFWSLCLLLSIPFFALCIQSRYLAGLEEGGSTIGTWLGLFLILNQVAQAFVLTPLYHLFGEVADDRQRLYSRVKDGFFIALIAGTILSAPSSASQAVPRNMPYPHCSSGSISSPSSWDSESTTPSWPSPSWGKRDTSPKSPVSERY